MGRKETSEVSRVGQALWDVARGQGHAPRSGSPGSLQDSLKGKSISESKQSIFQMTFHNKLKKCLSHFRAGKEDNEEGAKHPRWHWRWHLQDGFMKVGRTWKRRKGKPQDPYQPGALLRFLSIKWPQGAWASVSADLSPHPQLLQKQIWMTLSSFLL